MSTRLQQLLIVLAGALVALVMVGLGLWQMQVFVDQGNRTAAARAQESPVPLLDNVGTDGSVGDMYGKPVVVTGRYLPDQQVLVQDEQGGLRVLTAFQVHDGRVLAVVRGSVAGGSAPPPPVGELTQGGVFLPSEAGADHTVQAGRLGAVRLPLLAQEWPQQLLPGFITVDAAESARQGLGAAALKLPTEEGSWRNGGYALQWWVFAAFGFAMSVAIARSLGLRHQREVERGLLEAQEVPPAAPR